VRPRTARELTAPADGTLPPERRETLLRRIARSPEPARALDEQRLAATVVRGLSVRAPDALRAWVEHTTREPPLAREGEPKRPDSA